MQNTSPVKYEYESWDLSQWAEHFVDAEHSYGLIIIHPGTASVLIFQGLGGHWGFAKGHRNNGESGIRAAYREVEEETGLAELDVGMVDMDHEVTLEYVTYVSEAKYRRHLVSQHHRRDRPYWYKPGNMVRRLHFWPATVADTTLTLQRVRWDPSVFKQAVWAPYETARALMIASSSLHVLALDQIQRLDMARGVSP
jgi:8-oxo-dGTP pyrophosphatase MutT (NUDIX family)